MLTQNVLSQSAELAFSDLQMAAVYLDDIGDTDALAELKRELEQLIQKTPAMSDDIKAFKASLAL